MSSTALTGFLNCNGVAESIDEVPMSSCLCGTEYFIEGIVDYESESIECSTEGKC